MRDVDYVLGAQDWLKVNAMRRVVFCVISNAKFLVTFEEAGKILTSASGSTLAEATKRALIFIHE